jgi:hypothetical protein
MVSPSPTVDPQTLDAPARRAVRRARRPHVQQDDQTLWVWPTSGLIYIGGALTAGALAIAHGPRQQLLLAAVGAGHACTLNGELELVVPGMNGAETSRAAFDALIAFQQKILRTMAL